jgi:hypothetical protein
LAERAPVHFQTAQVLDGLAAASPFRSPVIDHLQHRSDRQLDDGAFKILGAPARPVRP